MFRVSRKKMKSETKHLVPVLNINGVQLALVSTMTLFWLSLGRKKHEGPQTLAKSKVMAL